MYTLRRLSKALPEQNISLGVFYEKVIKDQNPEQYTGILQERGMGDLVVHKKYFGFIINAEDEIIFLCKDSNYYVMTERGQTFDFIKP